MQKSSKYIYIPIILCTFFVGILFTNVNKADAVDVGKVLLGGVSSLSDATLGALVRGVSGFIKETINIILQNVVVPVFDKTLQFNDFFTAGVNAGWATTRDFANLFFALILLFIAVATVLNIGPLDNYTAKRMLPSFIFVALFINFSKAIVGLFLDISQIIMIEFYNALGQNMATTIADASRIAELGATANTEVAVINIFTTIIIAVLMFVLLWTIIILIIRIVTIWIVIITAPLAFISLLIPPLRSLWNQWTQKFQSSLVTGPVLMIMLYLSMTVLQGGIGAGGGGTNFIENTSFFNYLIVIIMLMMANIYAQQAGQQAPGVLKNAVGTVGTLATLGIGAKIGAGGTGLRQGLKDVWGGTGAKVVGGVKGTITAGDKTIGGVTRGAQILSGGKVNPNDRYESWKSGNKAKTISGKALGGGYFGNVMQQTFGGDEGRKKAYEGSRVQFAEEAKVKGTLDDNPALKKVLATYESSVIADYKEEENTSVILDDIAKAVNEKDMATARALTTHLNSLGKISELFNEKSPFKDYALNYATEGDMLDAFIANELGDNGSKYDTSFRVRNANIAKSKKGQENYSVGITDRSGAKSGVNPQPQDSALFKKYKEEALSDTVSKLPSNIFSKRKVDPTTGKFAFQNGKPEFEFDMAAFDDFIANKQINELEDGKTWRSMSTTLKNTIITELQNSGMTTGKTGAALQGLTK